MYNKVKKSIQVQYEKDELYAAILKNKKHDSRFENIGGLIFLKTKDKTSVSALEQQETPP
ncbi:hypothetical protein PsorP6_007001 [Peronosclerospora sorghi]|uniref:Uncharacterized protein n=1 Tax=Peronosclerospora sorghi TaxID=230839 RepID=A0ACC0WA45_9STRA|nr:hypothetical protein PsorP6_007001 [Peronosclerospora sorghi]